MRQNSLRKSSSGFRALLLAFALCATVARPSRAEAPLPGLETVAQIGTPALSGVVVTPKGRIFLSFPRGAEAHPAATLAEYRSGLLVPFPNAEMSLPGEQNLSKRLVSVEGVTLDSVGHLWAIDSGRVASRPLEPGAVKVVGINVAKADVIATVALRPGSYLPSSHLRNLRVDLTHGVYGTAFVTDSSTADPALVVVDLATGQTRRLFERSRFTAPDPHFMTYVEGVPRRYDGDRATFPQGGVNGLELSADSQRLYWTALSGRDLFSAPTAVLANPQATPEELEAAVRHEGQRPNTDGIARDSLGRLYFGAFDQRSIVRRNLDGSFTVVARDGRLGWCDTLYVANDYLYVALGQTNRVGAFNAGKDARQPPFLLTRFRLR